MSEKKWIKKACSIVVGRILVFGLLTLILLGNAASAAHTFDAKAQYQTTSWSTANPGTLSFTAGSGASVMVLTIFAAGTSYRTEGTPTFNGKSFTSLGRNMYTSTPEGSSEMWYLLLTPADTGSAHTVSVPNAATSRSISFHVSTFKSATGVSDLDVNASKNAQSSNPAQSVTTTANGDVIVAGMFSGLSTAPSVTSPGTAIYSSAPTNYKGMSQYYLQASAGTQALGWTSSTSDDYSMQTAAFKEVVAIPVYSVFASMAPSAQSVVAGNQVQYTVTINNTGNTPDSYTLSLNNANTADFSYSLASTSTGSIAPGTPYTTTMTVTASSGAVVGHNHLQSITATSANANNVSNTVTTTVATSPPPGSGEKIFVATNRYVILDDPISTGKAAQTAANFALPWSGSSGWSQNAWTTAQTTIKGYALVLSTEGTPIVNTPVIFTVRNWDSSDKTTSTAINTDANGIASYSLDMNAKNYYGNWYVDANATTLGKTDSTGFIYNWWGCNAGGCNNHGSDSPGTATPTRQNSPYTLGRETITSNGNHGSITDTGCVGCHRSYGGTGGGANFAGQPTKTADVHITDTCATCHATIATHDTNEPIKSCTDCHSWTNLSQENTMISGTTPMSNYSGSIAATGHNPGSTIPCIICHGPMHNTTKPDESLRMTRNNIVEDSQCLTCHTSFKKHNGGVGCTVCHSQDAHAIKVLSQTAGYVNKGNVYQGDCTNCHQNSTFLGTLENAPKAGSYSGTAPQVQKPLNHSTDRNGTKWGTYWTSTKDACIYCHGDNKHDATRLGNASVPVGSDTIGGPIGSGTVCSSCHNPTDSNYAATMALFARDPVGILLNQANWNNSGTDHASYGTTDEACKSCHNGALSSQSASISEFVHNVDVGKGGGPNCVSCHDIGASQAKVDVSKMNTTTSIHNTLNSGATASRADNKRCYACHTTNTVSGGGVVNEADLPTSGHPDGYNTPKKCTQCHDQGNFSALIASEHNSAGSEIKTKQYATTNDSCVNCHNKTEMVISNSDPGGVKSIFASVSHYGSNKTSDSLYNTGSTSNCAYCHQNPSGTFTTEMVNASWNASIDNHTELSTNLGCINCHNSGRIHESTLTKPALTLPDSIYCQTCHSILSKQKHNGSVDCTDCHLASKQNIHPVQYLQPDGSFKPNSPENKTSAANCADCHQGTGLLNAPKVQKPLNHSNDPLAGQKWNNYWITGSSGSAQLSACVYCHGSTQHDLNALGRPSQFDGNNVVGSTISNTSYWCSSCHWQGYTSGSNNYNDMVNIFIALVVPPEITGHATYGANQSKPGYFNHSIVAKDDASCQGCHGGLTSSTNITGLLHDVSNFSEGSPSPPLNITQNQSIGLYDTRIDKYTESLCRNCHNSTSLGGVSTRHHNLNGSQINPTNSQLFNCQDCHPSTPGVGMLMDRNCINCHNGTAFWGNTLGAQVNITRPHHINTSYDNAGIGEPAQTRQCNVCHGSFIANYNDGHYIPPYNTSFMITPYADFKAFNATSGKYWGGCYACHQNSSSVLPVIMTQYDTHHGAISGWEGGIGHQKDSTPGSVCTWCHLSPDVQNETVKIIINGNEETVIELRNSTLMAADIANATFEPGTAMPINGTACEKCHSVQSIHNIQVVNNGQPGNGHIGNNSDCNGCHASWIAGAAPMQGAIIPSIDSITPSVVLAGIVNDITITGLNFVNDAYTSVVSVDGITYTPASITDTQIVVNIPALNAGVHTLQLVKGDAKSKLATLTAVTQTTVASAKLASGSITITGANFGPKPDPAFSDLGVFITYSVKGKPVTFRATAISWSDTSIVVDAGTAAVNDQLKVKDLNGQASTKVTKGK